MQNNVRPLYEIANEIRKDWQKVNYAAKPYLEAIECLNLVTDRYIGESAETQVRYFLSNAGSWKGETAKRIKAELKKMVGMK